MNGNINKILWNDEIGMYCNKYWDEYSRKPQVSDFKTINPGVFIDGITMTYTNKEGKTITKKISSLSLGKEEVDYFSKNEIPVTLVLPLRLKNRTCISFIPLKKRVF